MRFLERRLRREETEREQKNRVLDFFSRSLRRIKIVKKAESEGRFHGEVMKIKMIKLLQIEMDFSFIKFF